MSYVRASKCPPLRVRRFIYYRAGVHCPGGARWAFFAQSIDILCFHACVPTDTIFALNYCPISREQQSSDASKAFYGRAKRTLVTQMLALNFATVVYLVATWVAHYTEFGTNTAIIPLVLKVSGTTGILTFALGSPRRGTQN